MKKILLILSCLLCLTGCNNDKRNYKKSIDIYRSFNNMMTDKTYTEIHKWNVHYDTEKRLFTYYNVVEIKIQRTNEEIKASREELTRYNEDESTDIRKTTYFVKSLEDYNDDEFLNFININITYIDFTLKDCEKYSFDLNLDSATFYLNHDKINEYYEDGNDIAEYKLELILPTEDNSGTGYAIEYLIENMRYQDMFLMVERENIIEIPTN